MEKKNIFLFGLILIAFIVLVFAATTMDSPVDGGNYTTPFNISISVDANGANNMTNVTCYYNASGGPATTWLVEILNDTVDGLIFENSSVMSGLNDSLTYNISCNIYNDTGLNLTVSKNITFDSTPPNVSSYVTTVDGEYYKSSIVLNVSVNDSIMGIDSVYFNITNSSGTELNFTKASNIAATDYYNITLDTSGFTDGVFNITVWANDTQLNNLNNSEKIEITIDNTAPSSVTLSSSSTAKDSLTLGITIVDATSGINNTCTVDRTGASISGTGASQTLTETGLSCGTSYAYIVTCTDRAGNSKASTSTSFSTNNCPSSGSVTGGSTTFTWSNTYTTTDEQVEEGYTKKLNKNERVKVRVNNANHYVGIKELTATSATIEISSNPVEVKLDVGEDAKVDVNEDGYYDIYVKLNSIANNKADIIIQKVYEEIPEGESAVTTTGEEILPPSSEEEKDLPWLWVIIILLIIAAAVGGGVAYKKKN